MMIAFAVSGQLSTRQPSPSAITSATGDEFTNEQLDRHMQCPIYFIAAENGLTHLLHSELGQLACDCQPPDGSITKEFSNLTESEWSSII